MKRILCFAFCAFHLLSCGGGGSSSTDTEVVVDEPIVLPQVNEYVLPNTNSILNVASERLNDLNIDEFFEEAFVLLSEREIEVAISDGLFQTITTNDPQLNDISDAFELQSAELKTHILTLLSAYERDQLPHHQQVAYDVFVKDLSYDIEWVENKSYSYPATYGFFGWPGSTELFFTQAFTFNNLEQAQLYLTLLNQVQRRFKQIETLLDTRAQEGVVEPAWTLSYSKSAVDGIANSTATQTSYYKAFKSQLDGLSNINSDEKQVLVDTLIATIQQRILPAYQSLSEKMETHLASAPSGIGFGQFAGGKEFYQFTLNYFTNSNMSAEQIHQLGIDELERIHVEMRALFDQLNYPQDESLAKLYGRVDRDAPIIAASKVKSTYEEIIAQTYTILPNFFETLPEQEVVVIGGQSGGYYIAGSDDGSRPGAFYANTVNDQPYTTMPTLAYHEAVPGHHLQIALANELDLPLFMRKAHFTSYIEGWALYAERLAKDVGWYNEDIYGDLGRLQFEAMRAARLVVDTGIHYYGWDEPTANNFHIENVGFSGSISRYSVWPGQATAYTAGMLKILELREMAQTQLGELFDIREFHTAVLGHGAIPLDVLDNVVSHYVETKLESN